jgi:YD repeat-containing protein
MRTQIASADAAGNATFITDPDDYSLTFAYDAMNRPVMAQDKAGHTVVSAYQLDGQPRIVTDPEGNSMTYQYYDSTRDGRLKTRLDPLLRATTYDYDANGNTVSITDNKGNVSQLFYDELNRPVRSVGPAVAADGGRSPVTCTRYDTLGRVAEIWAGATTTPAGACDFSGADPNLRKQLSTQYDDFGRKLKETDALNNVQTWQYDTNGNVTQYTDAKGQSTVMTWDYGTS